MILREGVPIRDMEKDIHSAYSDGKLGRPLGSFCVFPYWVEEDHIFGMFLSEVFKAHPRKYTGLPDTSGPVSIRIEVEKVTLACQGPSDGTWQGLESIYILLGNYFFIFVHIKPKRIFKIFLFVKVLRGV